MAAGVKETLTDLLVPTGLTPGLLKDELDVTSGGEKIQPKVDDERFDRAISTLADALRESISRKSAKPDGDVGTTE